MYFGAFTERDEPAISIESSGQGSFYAGVWNDVCVSVSVKSYRYVYFVDILCVGGWGWE